MFGNKKPWYVERWYDEDLAAALDTAEVPVKSVLMHPLYLKDY